MCQIDNNKSGASTRRIRKTYQTRSPRRCGLQLYVINESRREVSGTCRCSMISRQIQDLRIVCGYVPSAPAARFASLADRPTGQLAKVQFISGKSGKKPYPPALFPPVPSSCMSEIPNTDNQIDVHR